MVEIQSCASLVNASALCAIEEEVKGESVIAEISAELQRERQKNAELMERISILEAQIQGTPLHGSCSNARDRCFKKFKRQKTEPSSEKIEGGNIRTASETQCIPPEDANLENRLVNWMSMDDTQFFHIEKFKESDTAADCDDTDDSDEDDEYFDENDIDIDHKDRQNCDNVQTANELKELLKKDSLTPHTNPFYNTGEFKKHDRKETQALSKIITSGQEFRGWSSIPMQKKSPKTAFCPKEVKKIMELEELLLKSAHSHTIRKIIVFASLGIRHGCEDMYELDFNHFSILRKGEPYVSLENPGEHALYENPGVRRKVFYPNRQNPTLCPVLILEEEKNMRPSDASCPSCLFLCIKYGGRTRNLPQNEYVRQRMGRNKLKSFGPVICRMAMLVHIRSGSFFFKAMGITLLFMAGFPDDLVQKETKYRNLDLLQKYYRTDKDAEGEELFLSHPLTCNTQASPNSQPLTRKAISTKSKGKKHTSSTTKPHNSQNPSILHSPPSTSSPPTQFGLMGYTSIQTHAMSAFQSMPPQTPADCHGPTIPYCNQYSYPIFPPYQANSTVPTMYWAPPNAFYPSPYPSSYDYRSFPSAPNYISIHPHSYCSNTSCNPFIPEMVEGTVKNGRASAETDIDSNSSSSSTEPKEERAT